MLDGIPRSTLQFRTLQLLSNHGRKLVAAFIVLMIAATGTAAGEDFLVDPQGEAGSDDGP